MSSPPHHVSLGLPNCLYNRCAPRRLIYRLYPRPDSTFPPSSSKFLWSVWHSSGIWSRCLDKWHRTSSVCIGHMSSYWFSENRLRGYYCHTMLHTCIGSVVDKTAFPPHSPMGSSLLHCLWSVSFGRSRVGWNGRQWLQDAHCPDF